MCDINRVYFVVVVGQGNSKHKNKRSGLNKFVKLIGSDRKLNLVCKNKANSRPITPNMGLFVLKPPKEEKLFGWCYIENNYRAGRPDIFFSYGICTYKTTDRDNRTTDYRTGKLMEQQEHMFTILSFISLLILNSPKVEETTSTWNF